MTVQVRLAERFVALRETDDEYRLLSSFESLLVRTENGADALLKQVLPLLRDGIGEDRLRALIDPRDLDDLDVLLAELLRRGLVEHTEEPVGDGAGADRALASQVRFLANFMPLADGPPGPGEMPHATGSETQARIARAPVVLLGGGRLADRVQAQLLGAGMTALTSVSVDAEKSEALRAAVQDSELVVVCPDDHRVSLSREVNRLCLEAGRSWTSARTLGSRVEVGPTIVPGETACFGCYEQRRQSNDPGYRDGAERAERLAALGLDTGRLAIEAADGVLTAEVLKIAGGFSRAMTYGALFTLDLVTLESGLHPVLKIPRCASCGAPARNRPTTSVWPFMP